MRARGRLANMERRDWRRVLAATCGGPLQTDGRPWLKRGTGGIGLLGHRRRAEAPAIVTRMGRDRVSGLGSPRLGRGGDPWAAVGCGEWSVVPREAPARPSTLLEALTLLSARGKTEDRQVASPREATVSRRCCTPETREAPVEKAALDAAQGDVAHASGELVGEVYLAREAWQPGVLAADRPGDQDSLREENAGRRRWRSGRR